MSDPSIEELLEFARDLAVKAGEVTLQGFREGGPAEIKSDLTPVTEWDRAAERLCRAAIEERFPEDGILGEEYGEARAGARRRWILDPIDGTRSFVRGVPLYGVLIAVETAGEAVVGVMHFPALGETVAAGRDAGCWWNGARARVSEVGELDAALLLTTDAEAMEAGGHGKGWAALAREADMARTWGDCYGHALVATGRAEVMVDPVLAPWDAAPLLPIVAEAGGVFTDWEGRRTHAGGAGIATNVRLAARVHEALSIPSAPR